MRKEADGIEKRGGKEGKGRRGEGIVGRTCSNDIAGIDSLLVCENVMLWSFPETIIRKRHIENSKIS